MIKLIIGRTLFAAASIVSITTAFGNAITGPSSSETPYLLRARPGVVTVSVFTVGDSVNFKPDGITPYRMVGIADGLGAFDNGDGTFTVRDESRDWREHFRRRDHSAWRGARAR